MEGENILLVMVPGVSVRVNPLEAVVDVLLEIIIFVFPAIAFLVILSKSADIWDGVNVYIVVSGVDVAGMADVKVS